MVIGLYFNDMSDEIRRGRIESGDYDLPRDCPNCGAENSVIGNGRRQRWCLGSNAEKIAVRLGKCKTCHKTFTFLPTFARPYSRYSVSVVQDTILSFFSDAESTLFESVPDIPNTASAPDFKTLYNWLHAVSDRARNFSFDFKADTDMGGFPLSSVDIIAKKVRTAFGSLFGKLHEWLYGIKKQFDNGSSICFKGLHFHAGNFFQALFAVEKVLAWRLP